MGSFKQIRFLQYCIQDKYLKLKAIRHFDKTVNVTSVISYMWQYLFIDIDSFLVEKSEDKSLAFVFTGKMTGVFFKGGDARKWFFKSKEIKEEYLKLIDIMYCIENRTKANKEAVKRFKGKTDKEFESKSYTEANFMLKERFDLKDVILKRFELNDIVRMSKIGKETYNHADNNPHDLTGYIIEDCDTCFRVNWSNGTKNVYYDYEIEIVHNWRKIKGKPHFYNTELKRAININLKEVPYKEEVEFLSCLKSKLTFLTDTTVQINNEIIELWK